MQRFFGRLARRTSDWVGSPWAFVLAVAMVLAWAAAGPFYNWSDTHQLVINTSTTICTYLIVFLLQHSQNADTAALQAKLDELIHAIPEAHDELAGIEQEDQA